MLYAHAAGWPVGLSHLVGQVREVRPTHATAAALLGDFNRPGGIATSQAGRVARPPGRMRQPTRRPSWSSSSP